MVYTIDHSFDKTQKYPPGKGYGHRTGAPIVAVIIHSTNGGVGSSFQNEALYLRDSEKVSSHFLVGKAGQITCIVPPAFCAWHSGDCTPNHFENNTSIGIETHFTPGETWPAAGHDALTWLVRQLIQQYQFPKANIDTHRKVATPAGRKIDPSEYADTQFYAWRDALYAPPKLTTYRVWSTGTIYIRQGPGKTYPVAGTLHQGDTVLVDKIEPGQAINGDTRWAHVASGLGFVTMTVLEAVS